MKQFLLLFSALLLISCHAKRVVTSDAPPASSHVEKSDTSFPAGFAGLKFYSWKLVEIVASDPLNPVAFPEGIAKQRFELRFRDKDLSIIGGCNRMNARIVVNRGERLQLGSVRMTKKGCAPPLNRADSILSGIISDIHRYQITPVGTSYQLRLHANSGVELLLVGNANPELLYGESTRRFIEVASSTELCAEKPCLKWRDVTYSPNHVKLPSTEDWQMPFPGVRGFRPESGLIYVLRLKEYQTPKGPLWYLDMMVEVTTGQSEESPNP